jgi:hypothetical protein
MSTVDETGLTRYQKAGLKIKGDRNPACRPEVKKKISDSVRR